MTTDTNILEALPVAIYTTDAEGRITYYNQAAAELWGHRPELGSDKWCGSWRIFWPDGRPLPHDECPMAIALKEGRAVRGIEAVAERPDGTRVPFLPYPSPLFDESGRLTGAINLLVDLTERQHSETELARLAAIVTGSDDAIISKTLDGRITSWNAAAERIFGYEAAEMIGQPITRIIPPDLHGEEKEIIARIRRGEQIEHYDTVRMAKNGRRIDISLSISPLRDMSGKVVGASKIARDVTERRQAEALQRLLMDELNHRIKNTLATVQAMASQSWRHSRNPTDFVAGFNGRVQALARANASLTGSKMRGVEVGEIVRDQVMLGAADDRISSSGPSFALDQQASVHLALVLHELGTNARKYGALSIPRGRLSVSWELPTNHGRHLLLKWKEHGGPRVNAPAARGFGTTLIEETLRAHGGEAVIHYSADGVSCDMTLPLPEEAEPAARFSAMGDKVTPILEHPINESTLQGKRVLIVEDEPLLAIDIEAGLTDAGCIVVGPAGTVEKARQLIANGGCDAALLDANLAGHSVEELAADLTRKNIPFAFVTGFSREGLPKGFRDSIMLAKPFSQDQLRTVVEVLLYQGANVVRLQRKTS